MLIKLNRLMIKADVGIVACGNIVSSDWQPTVRSTSSGVLYSVQPYEFRHHLGVGREVFEFLTNRDDDFGLWKHVSLNLPVDQRVQKHQLCLLYSRK